MPSAPTQKDFFELGRAEAALSRPELTIDEGDISEMLLAGAAAMGDHAVGYAVGRIRATFLDGAKGDDLTILVDDHWNLQRFPAEYAIGPVLLSRTMDAGAPAGTLLAGTVVGTARDTTGSQVTYTLDADLPWNLDQLGPLSADVTATVTGRASNVALNAVNQVITPNLFDKFTCTNSTGRMVGGEEQESDDDLRERVRNYPNTLRRGTLEALEFGAKTVGGVTRATAIEDDTGICTVYVSDSQGNSNPTMVADVVAELEHWRAAGALVNVSGAVLFDQAVSLSLVVRAGFDPVPLIPSIRAALIARGERFRSGEKLTRSVLRTVVINLSPLPGDIVDVTFTNPVADVQPDPNEIIRISSVSVV